MAPRWDNGSERYRFGVEQDLPAIVAMLADREVARWLWFLPAPADVLEGYFRPRLQAQTRALADEALPATALFTVLDRDGEFLGQGAAVDVEGSPGGIEIGFQLRRAAWGRGVGRRLGEFLRAWSLVTLSADRVQASCLVGNAGSQRILEGLGLRHEGTRRGYRLKDTTRHDEALFGARRDDFDLEAVAAQARGLGLRRGWL